MDVLYGQRMGKLNCYEHCVFDKQCRVSFSTIIHRTKGILVYIHSEVWGPSQVPSKGGEY